MIVLTRYAGDRELRQLALDEDTALQLLAIEALNDLLKTCSAKPSAKPIDAGSALPAECAAASQATAL